MPIDLNCLEKVDLFLTCSQLPKMQNFSDTDAFCVIYSVDPITKALVKEAVTEMILNNQNPVFAHPIAVDYYFESIQEITVEVYQWNKPSPLSDLYKHTKIGKASFLLSNLMCTSNQRMACHIEGAKSGMVSIRGEARQNTRDLLCLTFSGAKLANKDGWFGKSDPFLIISRVNEDGSWQQVWKSPVIDNSLNPKWAPTKIAMTQLCNGDLDRPLRIDVWDWEKDGRHDPMGSVETSVRSLLQSNGTGMSVVEVAKKGKKGYTNSGLLTASNCVVEHHPTFTQFIQGGMHISLNVAIDFTGSNGDPMSPSSLHYISPNGAFNGYQNAIQAIGSILDPYDTDHMYPVFGFGAKIRQADGNFSPVQHCFPVYGGGVEVQGINGIMQAYRECLQNVALSGPTIFGPLIQANAAIAAGANCSQQKQHYTILLILTDGVINDMDSTIQSIIEASKQPLSIIIVGIGAADFTGMSALDSDAKLLSAGGKTAERDIVQFVSYNDCAAKGTAVLAAQVLAEVPNQVLSYMEKHRILPNAQAQP